MRTKPEPQVEGKLITDARKRARLSTRAAAWRAGMSEGRWRQIANGYQVVSRGTFTLVVNAPAETVARMAHSVDVTPEELEEAGRPDAADELRNLNAGPEATDRGPTDLDDRIARMKANPRQRWWLEKIIEIVEDCGPA